MVIFILAAGRFFSGCGYALLAVLNGRLRDKIDRLDKVVADHLAIDPRYTEKL